jgi:hypothetical protein
MSLYDLLLGPQLPLSAYENLDYLLIPIVGLFLLAKGIEFVRRRSKS